MKLIGICMMVLSGGLFLVWAFSGGMHVKQFWFVVDAVLMCVGANLMLIGGVLEEIWELRGAVDNIARKVGT
jgi:hypothetical protein